MSEPDFKWKGACDGCDRPEALCRYSPEHEAHFCGICWKRIVAVDEAPAEPLDDLPPGACPDCRDTQLHMGGWMGPTPEAPYPKPCPRCATHFTPRDLQNAYARYLHSAPEAIFNRGKAALDNQRITIHPADRRAVIGNLQRQMRGGAHKRLGPPLR